MPPSQVGGVPALPNFWCSFLFVRIALSPPSILASSTMGEAILLGTCLTGLQGLQRPPGWEPAEAAVTNNVVSKATGVDLMLVHREPGSTEPEKTTIRKYFYHVLSLTMKVHSLDSLDVAPLCSESPLQKRSGMARVL